MQENSNISVSKDEFYAAVDKFNLMPSLGRQTYNSTTGYTALWRTPSGQVKGITSGIPHLYNEQYLLTK